MRLKGSQQSMFAFLAGFLLLEMALFWLMG
jgi:hypothetical protein